MIEFCAVSNIKIDNSWVDPGVSPFEMPAFECRSCGRTEDHTYCIRWMERLHLWGVRIFGG